VAHDALPAAPVVAAAMLLASPQIWSRGLTDIRAEAFTLALFWWGVVLVTWSREASFHAGVGIGLAFFANLWNPKWPLEGAFLGVLYLGLLWRVRREPRALAAAIVPAIVIAAVALLPLFSVTTPRDFLFFNFQFKAAVVSEFTSNPWIVRFFEQFPLWSTAAPQHRWWIIIPAIVLAAISTRMRRDDTRLAWIAIALAICALVELRFIYPYPYLWAQYLVMVATTSSLVYAMIAAHNRVVAYVATSRRRCSRSCACSRSRRARLKRRRRRGRVTGPVCARCKRMNPCGSRRRAIPSPRSTRRTTGTTSVSPSRR
jgi:hypothetical protein